MSVMPPTGIPAPGARIRHSGCGDIGTVVPGGFGGTVRVRYDGATGDVGQFAELLTVVSPPPSNRYAPLLAAYLSADPSDRGIYAQHIAERLIADDLFGQLAALRDLLSGLSCGDAAVDVLNEILGEA